jgi:CheY-like chemotaxis protein
VSEALSGTRVLVVEDEAIIAMMAEDMLADLGCEVAAIETTLAGALERVGSGEFDVALLDMNLNGDDSGPVAERLKERARPFVFTTGYGDAGRPAGFEAVPLVCKPYRAADLGAAIAKALGR